MVNARYEYKTGNTGMRKIKIKNYGILVLSEKNKRLQRKRNAEYVYILHILCSFMF